MSVEQRSHDSVTISWTPGDDGQNSQWFYVNYREVLTSTQFDPSTQSNRLVPDVTQYTLVGLSPYTVYEIKVYAENAIGSSEAVRLTTATLCKFPSSNLLLWTSYSVSKYKYISNIH